MERKIAIYARKSVEKIDSISIESQIEFCEYETRGKPFVTFSDNGYSGKNTERPDFIRMMKEIKEGKISTVVVYKLDRISRSILDFSEMMETFSKYDVQFISATEKFDTSSPMGRAMLNICIVFAQLERETIQQRVKHAYASRSKKGFYMGGRIPYGYKKTNTVIDGVHTSKYEIVPEEAEDLKLIFKMYSDPTVSLGDIIRKFGETSPYNRRGTVWSSARLSEMMRNPAYCRADYSIYEFYRSKGAIINNPPEDFIGVNGLYLFNGNSKGRKNSDLKDTEIVIAPHEAIIDAGTWLKCRLRLLKNMQVRTSKPKNSWLSGLTKCKNCGYAAIIRVNRTKKSKIRYFICSCATSSAACNGIGRTVRANEFEEEIRKEIERKLLTLNIKPRLDNNNDRSKEIESLKIQIDKIESEINQLVSKLTYADSKLFEYINKKVEELGTEKEELENQIRELNDIMPKPIIKELNDCMKLWDNMSINDKMAVAKILIKRINIGKNGYEIEWNL